MQGIIYIRWAISTKFSYALCAFSKKMEAVNRAEDASYLHIDLCLAFVCVCLYVCAREYGCRVCFRIFGCEFIGSYFLMVATVMSGGFSMSGASSLFDFYQNRNKRYNHIKAFHIDLFVNIGLIVFTFQIYVCLCIRTNTIPFIRQIKKEESIHLFQEDASQ